MTSYNKTKKKAVKTAAKKTVNSHTAHPVPFRMTGPQCAEFMYNKSKQIASRLRGKSADIEDAISEMYCKCMNAEIGTGTLLKWDVDPFEIARTEEQWLSLLTWQCRARLSVIRAKNGYWHDLDIVQMSRTVDDAADLHAADRAAIEAACNAYADKSTIDAEKARRQRRIIEFLVYEEERHTTNFHPTPGGSYDKEISYEAAGAVLEDLVKSHRVSERDLNVWKDVVMCQCDRKEVARSSKITPNNLSQIKFRVEGTLKKYGPALHGKYVRRLFGTVA